MAREGQERVEIRPGAYVWFNAADAAAFRARQSGQEPTLISSQTTETAATEAPETAVIDTPKARRPK